MTINKSIEYCLEHHIFEDLNQIYSSVPVGKCQGCTKCCHESVNISMAEALNIVHHYYQTENGDIEIPNDITLNLLKYYFSEWTKPRKCPFLDQANRCSIYHARPLPCRLFGNRSKVAYERNLLRIRKQNLRGAKAIFSNLQLKIPRSVIERTIEYCENYQRVSVLEEADVNEFYDALINLDGKLFFGGVISEMSINQHLVGFFVERILIEEHYEKVTLKLLEEIKLDILRSININLK